MQIRSRDLSRQKKTGKILKQKWEQVPGTGLNNAFTHDKLQRCQSDMQITAKSFRPVTTSKNLLQHGLTAQLYLKFLLRTQYGVPSINTSEARKGRVTEKKTANVEVV